jgi:hypothetical protein
MLRIADLRSAWEVRKRDLNGALEGARFNGWTPGEIQQCQAVSTYIIAGSSCLISNVDDQRGW